MAWQVVDPTIQGNISDKLKKNEADWRVLDQAKTQEPLLQSLAAAPFRFLDDVAGMVQEGAQALPSYIEKAKTELPGFASTYLNNPAGAIKQEMAGIGEFGHRLLNMPSDFAKYLSERLNLFPKKIADNIPRQRDISQDINQTFGEPKQPGEALIRGLSGNIDTVLAGENLLNPYRYTNTAMARDVLRRGNVVRTQEQNRYNRVLGTAVNRGLGPNLSNIANNLDYNNILRGVPLADQAPFVNFLVNANPETAHYAKSQLLRMQRKLQQKEVTNKGLDPADANKLNAVNEAIPLIEENMFTTQGGNMDNRLANRYRNIQNRWARDVIPYQHNKSIEDYRAGRLTAKDLIESLKNDKLFKARALNKHPYMTRPDKAKAISKLLTKIGIGGGIGYLYGSRNKEPNIY